MYIPKIGVVVLRGNCPNNVVGDTRPDLSKVGNHVECNISLNSQVGCCGSSDWSKCGQSVK